MSEASPQELRQQAWPHLEAEIRNWYPSSQVESASAGEGKPYSFEDLPAWQRSIIVQFPSIYQAKEDMGVQSYCHLRFGFACESGWGALIYEISSVAAVLMENLRQTGAQPGARLSAISVTEQAGRLRWQWRDNFDSPFRELFCAYVHSIEEKSGTVCERCGKPGEILRVGDRLQTLCADE